MRSPVRMFGVVQLLTLCCSNGPA